MFVVVIPNVATRGFSVKLLEASDETESVFCRLVLISTRMHVRSQLKYCWNSLLAENYVFININFSIIALFLFQISCFFLSIII